MGTCDFISTPQDKKLHHGRRRTRQESRQGKEASKEGRTPTICCHDRSRHQDPEGTWWFISCSYPQVCLGQQQNADAAKAQVRCKLAIRKMVAAKKLVPVKGSFKLAKEEPKPKKKKVVKKKPAKKAKKPAAKKAKKPAAKKPAKKAAKKPAAKKPAAKKVAKKPAAKKAAKK